MSTCTVPRIVQYNALIAVTNIVYGSDANRILALELKAMYPLVYALGHALTSDIVKAAAMAISNIARNNPIAGATILALGGDMALVQAIQSSKYV